ncbi:hypothetical protein OXX79_012986 [Metschnikowia pulcherrima]
MPPTAPLGFARAPKPVVLDPKPVPAGLLAAEPNTPPACCELPNPVAGVVPAPELPNGEPPVLIAPPPKGRSLVLVPPKPPNPEVLSPNITVYSVSNWRL